MEWYWKYGLIQLKQYKQYCLLDLMQRLFNKCNYAKHGLNSTHSWSTIAKFYHLNKLWKKKNEYKTEAHAM